MGLSLTVETSIKIDATYWKLQDENISRQDGIVSCEVFGYENREKMKDGAKHLARRSLRVPYTEPFEAPDGIEAKVYPEIKKLDGPQEDWTKAEDVLEGV